MAGIPGPELELGFLGSIRRGQLLIADANGGGAEFDLGDPDLQQHVRDWMTGIVADYAEQMVDTLVPAEPGE
ncbi:hypothetical protein ACR8AL_07490 [Clavibacter sepedonicus]|uniref:Uncharacterized protein n=1 Tax=Clavibacter sepedonicus TaxID=31964 RepID=B0RJF9_CLASE|nr:MULTISPECIES: hypothetical protein [Clavibacter]MBD5382462.1 hypothetical protein [Clavibacter sp.]OQJ45290.1 hypothetical protein B5P19_15635 [Clavibacter sepedonicus]OQJ50977.1 hypothetical protein B5P20_16270 [Clavibacter sepedonicus]UUK67214.1 hypothetical protein LRE50_15765 [Clavibacter sepedonicus]CAQ03349.1 hypothetical protein pCSL0106 [Clavibacter sepedonicus]